MMRPWLPTTRPIQLDSNDVLAYVYKGRIYNELEQYEKALATYEQAIRLDPEQVDVYAYQNMGWALYKLKRYDEALSAYNKAILLDPNQARFYIDKGDVLFAFGCSSKEKADIFSALSRYDEAIGAYREALRVEPKNAEAKEKLDEAKQVAEEVRNRLLAGPEIDDMLVDINGPSSQQSEKGDGVWGFDIIDPFDHGTRVKENQLAQIQQPGKMWSFGDFFTGLGSGLAGFFMGLGSMLGSVFMALLSAFGMILLLFAGGEEGIGLVICLFETLALSIPIGLWQHSWLVFGGSFLCFLFLFRLGIAAPNVVWLIIDVVVLSAPVGLWQHSVWVFIGMLVCGLILLGLDMIAHPFPMGCLAAIAFGAAWGLFVWIVGAKALSTHLVFSLPWAHIFITQAHIYTGLAGLVGLVFNGILFSVNRAGRSL